MKLSNAMDSSQKTTQFTRYASDIMDCLFEAETRNLEIKMRSDQLEIRPSVIKLMQKYAKHQKYSLATMHLGEEKNLFTFALDSIRISNPTAIYVFDVYMDNYVISDYFEHQKLIGLVCLLLAAKSEDLDELVPSIKDILTICDMSNDLGCDLRFREGLTNAQVHAAFKKFATMYCKLEFLIFECMDFNLVRPTAVTFLNIFQGYIVGEGDIEHMEDNESMIEKQNKALEYVKQFVGLIIKDVEFFNITPSLLAASIVGSTRKLLLFDNVWNQTLVEVTRYNIDDIRSTMIVLIDERYKDLYDQTGNCEDESTAMDSGFYSILVSSESDEEVVHVEKKRRLNTPMIA